MLAARSFSSVCSIHRHSKNISCVRNVRLVHLNRPPRPTKHLRPCTSIYPIHHSPQRATFYTKGPQREATSEQAHSPTTHPNDQVSIKPRSNKEEAARNARQRFGDVLPRGHLSEEEFVIYQRLYGDPIFVEKFEEDEGVNGTQTGVVEETLPDGSTILLRRTDDGELEEVELFEENESEEISSKYEESDVVDDSEGKTDEELEALREQQSQQYHLDIYERSDPTYEAEEAEEEIEGEYSRAHPLTLAGRFKPFPSTVYLPKETFVEPIAELLTRANHKHLAESANQIFGGRGLPHSATTAAAPLKRGQKPIAIDPSHSDIGSIQADAYLAAVMPGTYATVMSTLVEVRKRLGTTWIERLLKRKGGPVVLDAGGSGAGILAWNEVLKAEWARMQEDGDSSKPEPAPLGKSTVLTGADTLRHRASRLLENTTFIPRLPDAITAEEEANPAQPRKVYDLIIAPHTLWTLRQEYLRKEQVQKYWSLLNPKGGVLIILEKGLPRGFEVVAAARQYLLDKVIASPDSTEIEVPLEHQVSKAENETRFSQKETGMIIAPCTNHNTCPMYQTPGISAGRKDFCYFSQRYIRPPFLQRILDATDSNHEDVQFSYLAVQRGRDQRLPLHDLNGRGVTQNEEASTAAFRGHEWKSEDEVLTTADVNPLSFPRLILPALKRRGHVTMDVCTPAGKLERWTVPRSFSQQAFRDARKSRWGDLWALGAKTRTPRNVRLGKPRDEFDKKGKKMKEVRGRGSVYDMMDPSTIDISGEKNYNRYNRDRKIRGSGGRKGRKKQSRHGEEEDREYD